MFADLLPPPTLGFDWALLGPTAGPIALLFLVIGLGTLFVVMGRRGVAKPRRVGVCIVLFVVLDLIIYYVGINQPRPPRNFQSPPAQSQEND
jgi:hypothetical protein